jgi:hypothetical protein
MGRVALVNERSVVAGTPQAFDDYEPHLHYAAVNDATVMDVGGPQEAINIL